MEMASVFAKTSEAKRLQVGALIVKENNIISLGVNGTPRGYPTNVCETLEGVTAPYVLHAEINALNKLRQSPNTSTNACIFITHAPCLNCAINILDAGITKVFYKEIYRESDGIEYLLNNKIPVIHM